MLLQGHIGVMDSEKITSPMEYLIPVKSIEPEEISSGTESQNDIKIPSPIKEVDEEELYDHTDTAEQTTQDNEETEEAAEDEGTQSAEVPKQEVEVVNGGTMETIHEEIHPEDDH